MTDPPKPKRKVTGQITISSPSLTTPSTTSTPSTPSHLPRARAKVDVSALPSTASSARPGLAHASSSTGGRPALRSTPSSASLRSTTSAGGGAGSASRARSPAPPPPLPSPSLGGRGTGNSTPVSRPMFRASTSQSSTPVVRRPPSSGRNSPVKETPTARVRASAVTQNAFAGRSPANGNGNAGTGFKSPEVDAGSGGGFFKRPSEPDRLRARITPTHTATRIPPVQPQAALAQSPEQYQPLLSPDPELEQQPWQARSHPEPPLPRSPPTTLPPDQGGRTEQAEPRRSISQQRSPSTDVQSPSFAQHALMGQIPLHPTASAPGSPQHTPMSLVLQRSSSITTRTKRRLPFNPATHAPLLPGTPSSPEIRTIDLPMMTPTRTRSREEPVERRPSLPLRVSAPFDNGALLQFDPADAETAPIAEVSMQNGQGSQTGAGESGNSVDGSEPQDISMVDGLLDNEDDVVEAKVNRKIADLEITNASLLAINRSLEATKSKQRSEILKLRRMLRESLSGPGPGPSLNGIPAPLPAYLTSPNPDDKGDDTDEEDMRDPELDARWDKVAEMVEAMNKKAGLAVERGKEEIKIGAGRVLDWTEVEGLGSSVGSMAGTPEPERVRAREIDTEGEPEGE